MEIDKIEKVHSIGYGLKDAKVTINQDFKFNIAGMKIEGTQGDTNNMPLWMGKILADNNIATLNSPDMITELKQALSKEKMVGEYQLSTLEPHFYIKLNSELYNKLTVEENVFYKTIYDNSKEFEKQITGDLNE